YYVNNITQITSWVPPVSLPRSPGTPDRTSVGPSNDASPHMRQQPPETPTTTPTGLPTGWDAQWSKDEMRW
ncbi:hypothetical protein SARC_17438, partial [Sphaeroforma arctica JP610]